jgi:hypothetical protein
MFEAFVEIVIRFLKFITKELETAYFETFGDKASRCGEDLGCEFNQEVIKRQNINKEIYIRKAAISIGQKILKEEGFLMPPRQALAIGEAMFYVALSEGKIDCLNNVISEE